MRQRITFLQKPEDAIDPKLIKVTNKAISASQIKAARHDKITFGLDDLPQELYRVLRASQELNIRWATSRPHETISPVVSRISPGLHVLYTPQHNSSNSYVEAGGTKYALKPPRDLLCPALKRFFGEGLDCLSPEQSFTTLSHTTQHYHPLATLDSLVLYLKNKICTSSNQECLSRISLLHEASTLDIDLNKASQTLTITSSWAPRIWDLSLSNPNHPTHRVEVGILTVESPIEPEEVSLGGFLTVIGQDTKPKPTLFSFPSRHHPSLFTFQNSFVYPTGLHPTLRLNIISPSPPQENGQCTLHTHLTLPRSLFADKYQLSDPLFLSSKNLSSIEQVTSTVDLEAPAYTLSTWGSSLLLQLASPPHHAEGQHYTAEIPLHLRYLPPSPSGKTEIEIPYPTVFWACKASDPDLKFEGNPFDRLHLGYEGFFQRDTMFFHVTPELEGREMGYENEIGMERLVNSISVPVLDLERAWYVESGTAVTVLMGFGWMVWCLWGVWRRAGYGGYVKEVKEREKKRQ